MSNIDATPIIDTPLVAAINPTTRRPEDVPMNDVFAATHLVSAPGSSVASFPAAASVASSSLSGLSQKERVKSLIKALDKEMHCHLEACATTRMSGNTIDSDAYLANVERARKEITTLRSLATTFEQMSLQELQFEGLKLTRHDTPKFCLATAALPIGGKVEVFESDKHYLPTLENIVESASYIMETIWSKIFPIGLRDHLAWVNAELKKCNNWAEAKSAFSKKFGSKSSTRSYNEQVFSKTMNKTESISEYASRFGQAVYMAGLDPSVFVLLTVTWPL